MVSSPPVRISRSSSSSNYILFSPPLAFALPPPFLIFSRLYSCFGRGSAADHRPHTPTTTPFQYLPHHSRPLLRLFSRHWLCPVLKGQSRRGKVQHQSSSSTLVKLRHQLCFCGDKSSCLSLAVPEFTKTTNAGSAFDMSMPIDQRRFRGFLIFILS